MRRKGLTPAANRLAALKREMSELDVRPNFDRDVPVCAEEGCPSYDGKRCAATGFRPDGLCEPFVIQMARVLRSVRP